jgi:DNA polymerase-3 subunit alpha
LNITSGPGLLPLAVLGKPHSRLMPFYELLSRGETAGIFQLESSGMTDIVVKMKPQCFEDLIALVALYRPGPLQSGMVDDFIKRKKGSTKITYELPELEAILKDTYGVIVYQEQVMQIARTLAGYSLGGADLLRRAMGKKDPAVMAKEKVPFLKGAEKLGVNLKKAEAIFDLMAKFAEYGFNKSHSAAYALVSYQTAYLKAHYPVEYMASLLTSEVQDTDKVVKYIYAVRQMGITILPPDVNESMWDFTWLRLTGKHRTGQHHRFDPLALQSRTSASAIDIEARRQVFRLFLQKVDA